MDKISHEEIRAKTRHAAKRFRGTKKTSAELFEWSFKRKPTIGESMVVAGTLRKIGCKMVGTYRGRNYFSLTSDWLYSN